jgi:hypothetical protein
VKGSHAQSALKKAYAAKMGIPLRTAQDHAKKNNPDYLAFVAAMGMEAYAAKAPSPPQKEALGVVLRGPMGEPMGEHAELVHVSPPAMEKDPSLWSPEEYAECQAWKGLCAANAARDVALKNNDPMAAVGFVKIAADALKSYHFARQKREQAEISAGRLKPIAAWASMKTAIQKMFAVYISMKGEIAQVANPDNPLQALRAIGDWETRKWNPAIAKVIHEIDAELAA